MVLAHLGDAALGAALLVMLAFGVDVKIIVAAALTLEVFGCLCKAFSAAMAPVVDAMKQAYGDQ